MTIKTSNHFLISAVLLPSVQTADSFLVFVLLMRSFAGAISCAAPLSLFETCVPASHQASNWSLQSKYPIQVQSENIFSIMYLSANTFPFTYLSNNSSIQTFLQQKTQLQFSILSNQHFKFQCNFLVSKVFTFNSIIFTYM